MELNKEENDLPLGADADTINRTMSRSTKDQEDCDYKNKSNGDDKASFRETAPSTAISISSTVSTGQLVPTSGKLNIYGPFLIRAILLSQE